MAFRSRSLRAGVVASVAAASFIAAPTPTSAEVSPVVEQLTLVGPNGSERFGNVVIVLSNGNYVVTDPLWDSPTATDVGAVYLYDGVTNEVISTLTGSQTNDRVGGSGREVGDSNVVIVSSNWANGNAEAAGAVTWIDGEVGLSGTVSPANSLVGSRVEDQVGSDTFAFDGNDGQTRFEFVLPNGNYVVTSRRWANGSAAGAGAVTLVDGNRGLTGPVSAANSLVGSQPGDSVGGFEGVTILSNGNFVVSSPQWSNGDAAGAGAVTWMDGDSPAGTGVVGPVSASNSIVGETAGDRVGDPGSSNGDLPFALANGNYVIVSPDWDRGSIVDAGAVTWGNGEGGTVGTVSATNSLVGSTERDEVGDENFTVLTNGNYVVGSSQWDNGSIVDAGAATFGNGDTGVTGPITGANSLIGTSPRDRVSDAFNDVGIVALTNGNYVVLSPSWNSGGLASVGAATFGNGTSGITGPINPANSLVGSSAFDSIGSNGASALSNGNYAVVSGSWKLDGQRVGAVTWGDGDSGTSGPVSATTSIISDQSSGLGNADVVALENGNGVIRSRSWDLGDEDDVGAVMWFNGAGPSTGVMDESTARHGTKEDDLVFGGQITPLANGNWILRSVRWDNGDATDAGFVSFFSGFSPNPGGPVTADNSLVGTAAGDLIGERVTPLPSGSYVVGSRRWNNETGAAQWDRFQISGEVSADNSFVGSAPDANVGENVGILPTGGYLIEAAGSVTLKFDGDEITGQPAAGDSVFGENLRIPPRIRLTSSDAVVLGGSNVVVLMLLDRPPVFDPVDDIEVFAGDAPAVTVSFDTPVADDVRDGALASTCSPQSGSSFTIGSTDVVCTARDAAGFFSEVSFSVVVRAGEEPTPPSSSILTSEPARFLDTRATGVTIDGLFQRGGAVEAGQTIEIDIAGRSTVPDTDLAGVVMNVTAINPAERGFITVHQCDDRPNASSLNFSSAGGVIANELVAKVSSAGSICLFTSARTNVAIDVVGHVPTSSPIVALEPSRLVDTRGSGTTIDGRSQSEGRVSADEFIEFDAVGRGGVPASGVSSVIVNVTAINPSARGFATAFPCGELPNASSLNFGGAGEVIANELIAPVSADGTLCLYSSADTHIAVDVVGYVPASTDDYSAVLPQRFLDTRAAGDTIDGSSQAQGRVTGGSEIVLSVVGRGDVPATGVGAVIVNLTAINPSGRGFLTLHQCGERPNASSLNFTSAGAVIANEVVAKVSSAGTVCIFTSIDTHLAADIVGYIPA